jgi:hypothetical protein
MWHWRVGAMEWWPKACGRIPTPVAADVRRLKLELQPAYSPGDEVRIITDSKWVNPGQP